MSWRALIPPFLRPKPPRPSALAAAKFWADGVLTGPRFHYGSGQIDRFEDALAALINAALKQGTVELSTDHAFAGHSHMFQQAAKAAGIERIKLIHFTKTIVTKTTVTAISMGRSEQIYPAPE